MMSDGLHVIQGQNCSCLERMIKAALLSSRREFMTLMTVCTFKVFFMYGGNSYSYNTFVI